MTKYQALMLEKSAEYSYRLVKLIQTSKPERDEPIGRFLHSLRGRRSEDARVELFGLLQGAYLEGAKVKGL